MGNQQNAIVVDCLNHPSCIAALQAAQARKDEAQARKDAAKAEKERQKTEIKLAKLRLQTERETTKREALASASQPASAKSSGPPLRGNFTRWLSSQPSHRHGATGAATGQEQTDRMEKG